MHRHKIRFTERFKRRLPLRLHMSLILLATGLSGLLTTRSLLALGIDDIIVRYPLAVLFSYLFFFLLIKLWLKFVMAPVRKAQEKKSSLGDVLSNIDLPTPGGGSCGSFPGGGHFAGAGGEFSGAGASGGFDDMGAIITEGAGNAFTEAAGGSVFDGAGGAVVEHGGSVVGDVAGEALGGLVDGEAGLAVMAVVAVIGTVIAIVLGAGMYMLYDAPFILSEAAFEVVLAASLIKGTRRMNDPDWMGSVFRTTWIPFGVSLVVSWGGAAVIHTYYPNATRIAEVAKQLLH